VTHWRVRRALNVPSRARRAAAPSWRRMVAGDVGRLRKRAAVRWADFQRWRLLVTLEGDVGRG